MKQVERQKTSPHPKPLPAVEEVRKNYCAVHPPSTAQARPCTLAAAAEHRNTANSYDIIGNIMKQRLRVLLDTNVLVAGLTSSRGASYALLQSIATGRLQIAASTALWLEYESVLKREEVRQLHGLSIKQIDNILSALAVWVQPVVLHYMWRPQLRDIGDEMVLEAAVNGYVSAITTHNTRDFATVAPKFGLLVLTPAQTLSMLEKQA